MAKYILLKVRLRKKATFRALFRDFQTLSLVRPPFAPIVRFGPCYTLLQFDTSWKSIIRQTALQ